MYSNNNRTIAQSLKPTFENVTREFITETLYKILFSEEIPNFRFDFRENEAIEFIEKILKELDSMKDGFNFEGYTFKGFFLDVEGTEALKANVPFNEDTTIYMIWDKNIDVTVTPNPEDTDKPVQDTTNKPEQKPAESDKTVKTDDNSQTILYGLMLSLSVVGAGIVVLNKKREKLLNK